MRQADLTRQRLVRTALELFAAQGYHVTTTTDIARKAGVAEGTIYRHFASKQQLLNELYRGATRWATKLVHDADAKGGAVPAKLALVASGLVDGAARDPAVARLCLLERYGALLDEDSRKTAREFRAALERVVAQGKAEGVVRAGSAEVWAGVWLAAVAHAVDRVATREWKPDDAAVGLVVEGAWKAIGI